MPSRHMEEEALHEMLVLMLAFLNQCASTVRSMCIALHRLRSVFLPCR